MGEDGGRRAKGFEALKVAMDLTGGSTCGVCLIDVLHILGMF